MVVVHLGIEVGNDRVHPASTEMRNMKFVDDTLNVIRTCKQSLAMTSDERG